MKIPLPLPTHNIFNSPRPFTSNVDATATDCWRSPRQPIRAWPTMVEQEALCLWAWSMTQLRRATSAQAVSRLARTSASPTSIKERDTSKMASIRLGWAPRHDRLKHCYRTESQFRILQNKLCRIRRRILQNKFCKTESCKSEFCRQNPAGRILQNDDEEILQDRIL